MLRYFLCVQTSQIRTAPILSTSRLYLHEITTICTGVGIACQRKLRKSQIPFKEWHKETTSTVVTKARLLVPTSLHTCAVRTCLKVHRCPIQLFGGIGCVASMGSYSEKTNLLEYLRSKSQVDCDCLDTERKLVISSCTSSDCEILMRC